MVKTNYIVDILRDFGFIYITDYTWGILAIYPNVCNIRIYSDLVETLDAESYENFFFYDLSDFEGYLINIYLNKL